jgi:hypothetical protein
MARESVKTKKRRIITCTRKGTGTHYFIIFYSSKSYFVHYREIRGFVEKGASRKVTNRNKIRAANQPFLVAALIFLFSCPDDTVFFVTTKSVFSSSRLINN